MAEANAINALTTGIVGNTGTSFTGTAVTQYNVITGASTSSALNNVAPSATSGVPVISQGSSSQPIFGTAVVAGGGTGITSTTAYGLIAGGTTSTNPFQTVTPGSAHTAVISGGTSALHSYTSAFQITSDTMTNTSQPCFLATFTGTDNNITGNNTAYTLGTNTAFTEIFDQGNNFVTSPCTFTAPVTGRYHISVSVRLINSVTATVINATIVSSNRSYSSTYVRPAISGSLFQIWNHVLADMDAADTITWTTLAQGESSDVMDLSNTSNSTFVSGELIC